jgi:hypothetical protein
MALKLVQMAEYQGPLYKVKYQFMQPTFIGTRYLVVRLLLVLSSCCEVHPKLFQIFLKL